MRSYFTLIMVFLFFGTSLFSQATMEAGWLPKFIISKRISSKYKWIGSLEVREQVYNDTFMFNHQLIDLSTYFSSKVAENLSLNIGYIYREKGAQNIHRTVQHVNFITTLNSCKLAHRIGFEQFFQKQSKVQFRSRYRFTFEIPLNGERIDLREWYLKASNEYLWQINSETLEIRFAPNFGFRLNSSNKIEFGLDYRLGDVNRVVLEQNLWFRTTWYLSLN